MENLVIVVLSDADEVSLIGKEENIENKQAEHGEEIDKRGADNSLRRDEGTGGDEGEEGDDEEDDELAGGVAHGGERGGDDLRHGVEGAAGDDNEEWDEIGAKGDGVKELKDGDAEEPSGEQADGAEGEDGEGEFDGKLDKAREILAEAGFEGEEEGLDEVLDEEGEDGGGHSDDAVDGLHFVSGDGIDGVLGGVNEVKAEEAETEDEEAFAGQEPNFGKIGLREMEMSLTETGRS